MDEFKSKKVKIKLPIKLDAFEIGMFAIKSTKLINEKLEEISGLKKLAKIKSKELEQVENHTAIVITTGVEEREIECEQVMNFAQGTVRFLDLKTKKVLHERKMSDEERQLDMFKGFEDPEKEKAFKRECNKCGELYVGTKRICFNCQKLDEYRYAPEGV